MASARQLPLLIILCCLLLTACRTDKKPIPVGAPAPAFEQEFSQGELTVKVELERMEMNVAQQTIFRLTTIAPEKYQVELPAFSEKLGDFTVVKSQPLPPELKGNTLAQGVQWTLEPFLSGAYLTPEMTIRAKADDKELSLVVPGIQVKVTSLLNDERKPADIAPMLLPRPDYFYRYLAGGLILLAAGLLALYWFKLRKAPEPPPLPPLPPQVLAARALDDLLARNLVEQGKIKEFYLAISAILRRYIENRFNLRAVEQTTEEFFLGLNTSPLFNLEQKQLLKKFLDHCDLVKFARHRPAGEETVKAISFCREFISNSQ